MARSINVMCWCVVLMRCVNAVPVCWCSVLMKCVNAVCWCGVLVQCFNAMCWCSVLMQCWWYKKHQSNHWTDIWPNWQSINSSLKWTCMNFVFTSLVDNVLWKSFLLYFMDTIYDWQIILWHLESTLYCGRWNKYNFVIYNAEQNC